MISPEEIRKLADLARIKVEDAELPKLSKDIESILGYVGQLDEVRVSGDGGNIKHRVSNVLRDDKEPHEAGIYTEKILANTPRRQGDYVVVKKIL